MQLICSDKYSNAKVIRVRKYYYDKDIQIFYRNNSPEYLRDVLSSNKASGITS